MANLLLTSRCVRACPYCFASREMQGSAPMDGISWPNVVHVAEFLLRSAVPRISLLGGEPTLHPEFVDIALYLLDRGFHVTVFTSGILSRAMLSGIERHLLPHRNLLFICNLNDPDQTPATDKEQESLHRFLAALGPRIEAGFNIYRPDFDLTFLFHLIERYDLQPVMRLGLAQPIPGTPDSKALEAGTPDGVAPDGEAPDGKAPDGEAGNHYLATEAIAPALQHLMTYRDLFDAAGIKPHFDCGFPLCGLNDEQLGWLYRRTGARDNFFCGMAPDITPNLEVYNCFPLAGRDRHSLEDFRSMAEVRTFFYERLRDVRREIPGLYDRCEDCTARRDGACQGGGHCRILNDNRSMTAAATTTTTAATPGH